MTGLVRRATLLTAVGLLVAAGAMANVPVPANSSQPNGINFVGHNGGIADVTSFGAATYTIRDGSNTPISGVDVVMNFSACTDVRICSVTQPAGILVNCASKEVRATTNASGVATFRIVGGGLTSGAAVTSPCVTVSCQTVPLNTLRVGTFDINGAGGLTAADVTLAKNDLNTNPTRTRSDFNKSTTITAADITILKNVLNGAGSAASCATYCP